jgi:hypothetical protein
MADRTMMEMMKCEIHNFHSSLILATMTMGVHVRSRQYQSTSTRTSSYHILGQSHFFFLVIAVLHLSHCVHGWSTVGSSLRMSPSLSTMATPSTTLSPIASSSSSSSTTTTLKSKCHCGKTQLSIRLPDDMADSFSGHATTTHAHFMIDCHCRSCRRYHAAALVSYLMVPASHVTVTDTQQSLNDAPSIATYRDICMEVGIVERLYCQHCCTKMATRPKAGARYLDQILVNWGSIQDSSIPKNMGSLFRQQHQQQSTTSPSRVQRTQWQLDDRAVWEQATPAETTPSENDSVPHLFSGGCACGAARYRFTVPHDDSTTLPQTELQHCYCRLCRRLSGSPFQTWMPVTTADWTWLGPPAPLVRTTPHGQRHMCRQCGSVVTIVYDEQPDCTWPAVGSVDATSWPASTDAMNRHLYRVCHICCRYKPVWYPLPEDGMERIPEAS